MAIHVNIYTQLMGINTITLLSGTLMSTVYPSLSLYFNLILNSIRLPPTIIATFYIGKKVGRRTLYMWSGIILGLSNYMIAVGYIFQTNWLIIVSLFVYMIIFSLLYTPINYAYPAEITPAPKITIANIFNQAAMAVSLLFPPILIGQMNGNGYPVFLFFGVYTTISLIYMYNCLKETKGKKYE
jgi:MFS family permease